MMLDDDQVWQTEGGIYVYDNSKPLSAIKRPLNGLLIGNMKGKIHKDLPEVCICEQFVYFPDFSGYPNSSDMSKLSGKSKEE